MASLSVLRGIPSMIINLSRGKNNDKSHPPIHPTRDSHGLEGEEYKVYEFVARRFLACCSENAKGKETRVDICIASESFQAKERNYLEVYTYDRWNANLLPEFRTGQTFTPSSLQIKQGKTSRPSLLTEAELINLMDNSGIGTDATIHEHIKKILEREYALKNHERRFVPTILGVSLISAYRDMEIELSLAKPDLRRMMESKMRDVCEQRLSKEDMVRQIINMYRNAFRVADGQSFLFNQHFRRLQQENANEDDNRSPPHGGGGNYPRDDDEDDDEGHGNDGSRFPSRRNDTSNSHYSGPARAGSSRPENTMESSSSIPSCDCNQAAVQRTVRKDGQNQGRSFFACGNSGSCDFFQWADEKASQSPRKKQRIPEDTMQGSDCVCDCNVPAALKTVRKEGPNEGRMFHSCGRSGACNFFQWQDEPPTTRTRGAALEVKDRTCACGLIAKKNTVFKEGPNKGKHFYSCVKTAGKCKYFEWADQGDQGGSAVPSTGACYKCGEAGHMFASRGVQWARSGTWAGARSSQKTKMSLSQQAASFRAKQLARPVIKKEDLSGSAAPDPKRLKTQVTDVQDTRRRVSETSNAVFLRQIYDVINLLKSEDDALDRSQLRDKLAFDIFNSDELLDRLRSHDRLLFDPVNNTFAYRHEYQIKSKEDLFELLKTNRQDGGFDWKKLKESYSNLPVALTELEEQRHAFVLRNHKDEPRMVQSLYVFIIAKKVFFNEKSLDLTISPDFKTMWDEIKLPSNTRELERELERSGLKSMEVVKKAVARPQSQAGRKKRAGRGRAKITNTHLAGFADLKKS
ncbi:MAG: hypothetical protein SGCHY_004492 [Lobulomycetales sp.]